jgi:hypothetical protein
VQRNRQDYIYLCTDMINMKKRTDIFIGDN